MVDGYSICVVNKGRHECIEYLFFCLASGGLYFIQYLQGNDNNEMNPAVVAWNVKASVFHSVNSA